MERSCQYAFVQELEYQSNGIADGEVGDDVDSIDRLPDFADGKAKRLHTEIKQHKSHVGVVGKELFDTKQR